METIEIYSSKKKSLLLLFGSLLFVVGGIYMFLHADIFTKYPPFFTKNLAVFGVIFFGLTMCIGIKRLLKNQLIFTINITGININPQQKYTETIAWKNINSFSEFGARSSKMIIINVDNPMYWIENEKNKMRKQAMKFNLSYCGSPFSISASSTQLSHAKLLELLNENLQKYRF